MKHDEDEGVKWYGVYRGICVSDADPESALRIKVKVPLVTGEQISGWAMPCVPPGWSLALVHTHHGHSNHSFTDMNNGEFASGNVAVSLSHDHNHDAHTLIQKTPLPTQGVWVMYEAGDVDYPIWIGGFA